MAVRVELTSKSTGLNATGYLGFSWTSLFFGFWPCVFRADWFGLLIYILAAIGLTVATFFVGGAGGIVFGLLWPFFYNKWHMRRLVAQGYEITAAAGMSVENARAIVNG